MHYYLQEIGMPEMYGPPCCVALLLIKCGQVIDMVLVERTTINRAMWPMRETDEMLMSHYPIT